YMASAWATLVCYASMTILSFILGQKHYPINYNFGKIGLYLSLALGLYFLTTVLALPAGVLKYVIHSLIIVAFLGVIFLIEKPLRNVKG
ncbi:MAG: hypothetical protein QMB65_00160, partial [Vicingaceae bacterium]